VSKKGIVKSPSMHTFVFNFKRNIHTYNKSTHIIEDKIPLFIFYYRKTRKSKKANTEKHKIIIFLHENIPTIFRKIIEKYNSKKNSTHSI